MAILQTRRLASIAKTARRFRTIEAAARCAHGRRVLPEALATVAVDFHGLGWESPPMPVKQAAKLATSFAHHASPRGELLLPEPRDTVRIIGAGGDDMAVFRADPQGPKTWVLDATIGAAPAAATCWEKLRRNIPNAVTAAGYALGLWWVAGGPAWAALVSIVADELDGRIARALRVTSDFGSKFDWTTDVVLTAGTLQRMKAPVWATLATTVGQVVLRDRGFRPSFGSARAALMLVEVVRQWRRVRLDRLAVAL